MLDSVLVLTRALFSSTFADSSESELELSPEKLSQASVHGAIFPFCQFSWDSGHSLLDVPEIPHSVYFLQRIESPFNLFLPPDSVFV